MPAEELIRGIMAAAAAQATASAQEAAASTRTASATPPPTSAAQKANSSTEGIQRIRVGGGVQAAKVVRQARPVYPQEAKDARVSGHVIFDVVIAKDGTISNLKPASGDPMLVPAAMEAVKKQWVYQPTLLNGRPVEVVTTDRCEFPLSK